MTRRTLFCGLAGAAAGALVPLPPRKPAGMFKLNTRMFGLCRGGQVLHLHDRVVKAGWKWSSEQQSWLPLPKGGPACDLIAEAWERLCRPENDWGRDGWSFMDFGDSPEPSRAVLFGRPLYARPLSHLAVAYYQKKGACRGLAEKLSRVGETSIIDDVEIPGWVEEYVVRVDVRGRIWWQTANGKAFDALTSAPLWWTWVAGEYDPYKGYYATDENPEFGYGGLGRASGFLDS